MLTKHTLFSPVQFYSCLLCEALQDMHYQTIKFLNTLYQEHFQYSIVLKVFPYCSIKAPCIISVNFNSKLLRSFALTMQPRIYTFDTTEFVLMTMSVIMKINSVCCLREAKTQTLHLSFK